VILEPIPNPAWASKWNGITEPAVSPSAIGFPSCFLSTAYFFIAIDTLATLAKNEVWVFSPPHKHNKSNSDLGEASK
jgi:hypothetical protein